MEGLKQALVVSIAARAWGALLGILAVPLYIKALGLEAYGLIGFFSSIQALTTILDFGLGATLIRELARAGNNLGQKNSVGDMVWTFELTYIAVAAAIGLAVGCLSPLLVQYWVQLSTIPSGEAQDALILGGVALAMQWPAGLYGSGLAGLHKQTQLAVTTIFLATFRVLLVLGVLFFVSQTIVGFFWAQVVGAATQSLVMRVVLWRNLNANVTAKRFHFSILRNSFGFAGGMTGIAITSVVLTQMDKVVLSSSLSLKDFGVYALSSALAMGLYMVISPIFSVIYPRFSALIDNKNNADLIGLYHLSSQTVAFFVFPIAAVIMVFSEQVLYVWTGDSEIARQGAWVLSFLVLGTTCNGVMNVPYALQLSVGWTSLSFWVNVSAIVFLIPCIWFFSSTYGPVGGAAIWGGLNLFYVLFTPNLMHKKVLCDEKFRWYLFDVFIPFLFCLLLVFSFNEFYFIENDRVMILLFLLMTWFFAVMGSLAALPLVRSKLLPILLNFSNRFKF
jgi:O-antigen/teichoic acid export membrane protein